MGREETLRDILHHKLVAVVRTRSEEQAFRAVEALVMAGVRIVEITLTTPGAGDVIQALVQRKMPGVVVGAGSAVSAADAVTAVEVGAAFAVTPVRQLDVISICHQAEMVAIVGALTPTECLAAHRAGADLIAVAPAGPVGGARYVRELLAPLPDLPVMPSGGVTLDTIADYLDAGARAVSVGGALLPEDVLVAGDYAALRAHARRFVELVESRR